VPEGPLVGPPEGGPPRRSRSEDRQLRTHARSDGRGPWAHLPESGVLVHRSRAGEGRLCLRAADAKRAIHANRP